MLFSSSQLLELFVVLCNVRSFFYAFSKVRSASAHAQSKSGPVRPDTLPARFSALFLAAQVIVCGLIPAIYIFAVVGAGFQQPPWMNAFTLPNVVSGVMLEGVWKNALRVLACVASISLNSISDNVFEHLSDQYHPIGVRPRSVFTLSRCTNLIDLGHRDISVARNRESSRLVRTPGFAIPSTGTLLSPFSRSTISRLM
jgi:hypothetical protein